MIKRPGLVFATVLVALLGFSQNLLGADECTERLWLDQIHSGTWQLADFEQNQQQAPLPDIMADAYGALAPLGASIAAGQFTELNRSALRSGLEASYKRWQQQTSKHPIGLYAGMLLTSTLGRLELIEHNYLAAWGYGREMLELADTLAMKQPEDRRIDLFRATHAYHSGRVPWILRPLVQMLNLPRDVDVAIGEIEALVEKSTALAPEAARILLTELKVRDRPACRYVSLINTLASRYPQNIQFRQLQSIENERCDVESMENSIELVLLPPCN
jgi:hypothetical protein